MSTRRSILLVDDDAVFRSSLAALLETTGSYSVASCATAAAAERAARDNAGGVVAILLDINLPDEDGISLCARLRSSELAMPIILLTGSEDEALLVRGLAAGADDFIRKPFRGTELLARLQTRLRTFSVSRDATIAIGKYVFHPGKRILVDPERNSRVPLADKEARLLWHLYQGNGEVVSRLTLLHTIWGYSRTATTHTVETHIYRLRQKIEADPARPRIVLTERGGYRFALPDEGAAARPMPDARPPRHSAEWS